MRGKGSGRCALALAFALVVALAGCGNQDGSLVTYAPEGQPGKAFTVADVVLADFTPTTTRLTLYVNNTGLETDSYLLSASTDPTFSTTVLPPGWSVTFLDSAFTPVEQTAAIVDSGHAVIHADITLPVTHPAGTVSLYFQALSAVSTTADVLHASVGVGVSFGRTTVSGLGSAAALGGAVLAVDLTANAPLPGGAGAGTGPEPAPVVTAQADLGPRALASGVVFDSSAANGMRFYFNPADQGFRPGTDYITRPSLTFSTGWSAYTGVLQGFDPFAGNAILGRGSRDGIESSAAVTSRAAFVSPGTPVELATRAEVSIISPRAPENDPTAIPTVFPPFTFQWTGFPGAAAYFLQIIGSGGPAVVAYTGGAAGDPGLVFLENQGFLPDEAYFWDVIAVDAQHRVNGFSFDQGSFLFTVPVELTNGVLLPDAPGAGIGPELSPVVTNTTAPGSTTRFPLYVTHLGAGEESYALAASTDPEFGTLSLPPGWAVVFRNEAGNPITSTLELETDEDQLVYADVIVPANAPQAQVSIYFRARSPQRDGLGRNAEDRIHDAVNVSASASPDGPLARSPWGPALARRAPVFTLQVQRPGSAGALAGGAGAGLSGGRTMIARPEHSLAARLGLLEQAAVRANVLRK